LTPPLTGGVFFIPCAGRMQSDTLTKERATVQCRRGDRILLVARLHARWMLPGGKPRRGELALNVTHDIARIGSIANCTIHVEAA
jgi:hypothetical protein